MKTLFIFLLVVVFLVYLEVTDSDRKRLKKLRDPEWVDSSDEAVRSLIKAEEAIKND